MISTNEGRSWETDYEYDYGIDIDIHEFIVP